MIYKWLVQLTVCIHWFNPIVYIVSKEINKACEFSCDESVLASDYVANKYIKQAEEQQYGEFFVPYLKGE
ncbi:M56 family metallopeptidase [Oceanirhabdus seepicola]|uniref:Peptidase M56 domain-containing protein n=1 Tax=Oceanirhabdus seepicola TaxID=2828781 RepID=A0A9J6NZL1_9CLOT|nr:hypothetical protein [Oceanirhabdus seepicola]